MYSPAFHTALINARIEDLRAARGTSIEPRRPREGRSRRILSVARPVVTEIRRNGNAIPVQPQLPPAA